MILRIGKGPCATSLLDATGSDPANAVGLAAIVPKGELVEVCLQVFAPHRAGMRAAW